jgi:hypothetical protein
MFRRVTDAAIVDFMVRLETQSTSRLLGLTSGTSMEDTPGYMDWKDGAATGLAKILFVDWVRFCDAVCYSKVRPELERIPSP